MARRTSQVSTFLALGVLFGASMLACDKGSPEPAPAQAEAASEPAAAPTTPGSTPAEAQATAPTPADPQPAGPAEAEPPSGPTETGAIGEVRVELGFSFQLGTKKKRADAEELRAQLEAAAEGLDVLGQPYVLTRDGYHLIMAGSFASAATAEANFEAAKAALGQGGFVREMREFCPGQRRDGERLFTCVDVELPAAPTLADPALADAVASGESGAPEPYGYPSPAGPDSPPITHAPAEQLLVIASNRGYSPGKAGVDRDGKYRTWIWRPGLGGLPDKGKWEPPEDEGAASEGAPAVGTGLIEIHKTLLLSDGAQLWQVEPDTRDIQLPLCTCLFGEAGYPSETLRKRLVELRAKPFTGGDAVTLIDAEDFPHERASDCIGERDHVDHVIQINAVAGSRMLVVERNVEREPCPELMYGAETEPIIIDTRSQRVVDLRGSTTLAQLEAELPYTLVKDARFKASAALTRATTASYEALAPTALMLTGVFPRYREFARGMRLTLQYSVEGSGEIGGWGAGYDSHAVEARDFCRHAGVQHARTAVASGH